jgi:hypothetical protein
VIDHEGKIVVIIYAGGKVEHCGLAHSPQLVRWHEMDVASQVFGSWQDHKNEATRVQFINSVRDFVAIHTNSLDFATPDWGFRRVGVHGIFGSQARFEFMFKALDLYVTSRLHQSRPTEGYRLSDRAPSGEPMVIPPRFTQ